MAPNVKILADSVNPDGVRLTTFELSVHRYIWPEFLTHRAFSRNAQSNRAIPTKKLIQMVRDDPAYPFHWGKNQSGMQAEHEHDEANQQLFRKWWKGMAHTAADNAEHLASLGLHKQVVNRILEPYQWLKVIITATDWDNFFMLRCSSAAQPEIRIPAEQMESQMLESKPQKLDWGDWHLPLISDIDRREISDVELLRKISVARCARVSYLTHDGKRDYEKDIELYERLFADRHMSPFEHIAVAAHSDDRRFFLADSGNFHHTWMQQRQLVEWNLEIK